MKSINTYLIFNGNCEEAFNYYEEVLGGKIQGVMRFSEMPASSGMEMPDEHKNRIMHLNLELPNGLMLFGSDTGGEWANNHSQGSNFSIMIDTESREEADSLYGKLSLGGIQTMPINETFWGSYFGTCVDKFGTGWMIGCNTKD